MLKLSLLLTLLGPGAATPLPQLAADTACITMNTEGLPLDKRRSPLDSVTLSVGGKPVKVCYGRPAARGRTMIGGENVPYGGVWRTGANEPTMIHATAPITIAGVKVPAGSYSLYTVPGRSEWEVIVNRSTSQWGEESNYTPEIKAQEVGRGKAKSERLPQPVEMFTVRPMPASGDAKFLVLEWERTRVPVPLAAAR